MTIFESISKSIAYIESNLEQPISVRDAADSVSYSQFYFSREFSRYTHMSVYDYIIKRKLSESYKRLFCEKVRIADLAFQYGFQSHEVYTRAFKKIFNETPSEAAVYKPLAVFEAIDDAYLAFLRGLRVERMDLPCEDLSFETVTAAESHSMCDSLVALSRDNLWKAEHVFYGHVTSGAQPYLSFTLRGLKVILRIYHTDMRHALRYFTDRYYDAKEMRSNCILLRRDNDCVELLIPANGY